MSKVRVYEYAKEHQLPSKKVIETLQALGVEVANHMSTINENALRQLDKTLLGPKKESAAPSSQPKAPNEAGQSKGSNKPNMNDKSNQSKPNNNSNKPASQGAAKPAASANKPTQGGQNRPNNSGGQSRPGGNAQGGGNRSQGGNRNNQNRGRKNNTKYKGKRNHSTVPPTPPKPKELPEKNRILRVTYRWRTSA